jgi:hypothetical protein
MDNSCALFTASLSFPFVRPVPKQEQSDLFYESWQIRKGFPAEEGSRPKRLLRSKNVWSVRRKLFPDFKTRKISLDFFVSFLGNAKKKNQIPLSFLFH